MKKILSVCIPTYNMEALLARCLDSFIVEKDLMNLLEVIVVNDGSKDKSLQIMNTYADKYPNTFIVIDKPNGNYGSCINAALKVASGKYFRICDADDHYDTQVLNEYIRSLLNTDADLTINPYVICSFDGKVKNRQDTDEIDVNREISINDINWKDSRYKRFRAMHCLAVKTKNLTSHNYKQLEGISYTDTQFVFYATLYSETCIFFEKPLYSYYLGRDGQTMSPQSMIKSNMHFYQISINILDEYIKLPSTVSENKRFLLCDSVFSELYLFMVTILLNMKKSKMQQKLLVEAIELSEKAYHKDGIKKMMFTNIYFKLWYKYRIPQCIVRSLYQIRTRKYNL